MRPAEDEGLDVWIDCADCVMKDTSACDDCVVTALCDDVDRPVRRVEVSDQAAAALVVLHGQGLAAPNRFEPRRPDLRAVS